MNLEQVVEAHYPPPSGTVLSGISALLAPLLVPIGFVILGAMLFLGLPALCNLVPALMIFGGIAAFFKARKSGGKIMAAEQAAYPALREEFLAGKARSVSLVPGLHPSLHVHLESGAVIRLHPGTASLIDLRDSVYALIRGEPWPRDPSAIPELENLADLRLRDARFRPDFIRGMITAAEYRTEVVEGTRLRGYNSAVVVTFPEGNQVQLIFGSSGEAVEALAVIKEHL